MRRKKGQLGIFIGFMFALIFTIVIASIFAAVGTRFNTELYLASEDILNQTVPSIEEIQDDTIRAQINRTVLDARDASANNIEVNAAIFQYGWIAVVLLTVISLVLLTRRVVNVGGGGGVI